MEKIDKAVLVWQILYVALMDIVWIYFFNITNLTKHKIYEWIRRFTAFCLALYMISKFWFSKLFLGAFSVERTVFIVLAILFFYFGTFSSYKATNQNKINANRQQLTLSLISLLLTITGVFAIDVIGLSRYSMLICFGCFVIFVVYGRICARTR